MAAKRLMYAMLGAATLLVGGSAFGGTTVIVDGTSEIQSSTTGGPLVEIVVYDGTDLPSTVLAGCSEPDCLGWMGSAATGTVTHGRNYVGWGVGGGDPSAPITLYVDGKRVDSASLNQLLLWNTRKLSAGRHTLVATTYNSAGVQGSSTPLTLIVVK